MKIDEKERRSFPMRHSLKIWLVTKGITYLASERIPDSVMFIQVSLSCF